MGSTHLERTSKGKLHNDPFSLLCCYRAVNTPQASVLSNSVSISARDAVILQSIILLDTHHLFSLCQGQMNYVHPFADFNGNNMSSAVILPGERD